MLVEVRNKIAVITGGLGGLGLALAERWTELGGKVVVADLGITEEKAKKIKLMGNDAVFVKCNVLDEKDCIRLADTAITVFKGINLVVPFAGIIRDEMMISVDRNTHKVRKKMPLSSFVKVIDVNTTGVFLTIRECVERMINNNCKGLVCLISSVNALGQPGQINYSASKAAISVMPRTLTAEFFRSNIADRIRCVTVAPGYTATPMLMGMNQKALARIVDKVPIGRLINPYEVAELIIHLFKNEACAGGVYPIDGGVRPGLK